MLLGRQQRRRIPHPLRRPRPLAALLHAPSAPSGGNLRRELLPQELFIYTSPAGGVWVDVVLSDWIEGVTLHEAVAAAAETGDTARLRRFAAAFDRMAAALTADDWAHGDLKPEKTSSRTTGDGST